MLVPTQVLINPQNSGNYNAVPYKDWAYPYDAKNIFEKRGKRKREQELAPNDTKRGKTLEPRFLYFLKDDGSSSLLEVSKWREKVRFDPKTRVEYVFVSYTAKQNFGPDGDYLHEVGKHAAREAGIGAYWVSTGKCLGETPEELEDTVWRICDIVRGAHSLVVAVSGPADNTTTDLMQDWSTRIWTWPEVLLSPGHGDIYVYRSPELDGRSSWAKRNLHKVWTDASLSGQLLDHYEGSVVLTPLELVTVALQCLGNRSTEKWLEGDLSYALMGLLRQRPAVVREDNAFQAFARLSLANDNNMLLERLICLLPETSEEPWYSLSDQWSASLWDIYPKTQVCGIGDGDTVIIDGVRGAAIRWDSFTTVSVLVHETIFRRVARYLLRTLPFGFLIGLILLIIYAAVLQPAFQQDTSDQSPQSSASVFLVFALIIFCPSAVMMILSPIFIRTIYSGKAWDVQPFFFGVEGYLDLETLERYIFGSYERRLKWSPFGSPLSRHTKEERVRSRFCIGKDPSAFEDVKKLIAEAKKSEGGDTIFTLVDTYTMTVTLFSAARPPGAVLLCGEEGGMQRAVLCSYDWKTSTLYRETVLRMETTIVDKMQYMPRVRLGLRRSQKDTSVRNHV